MQAAVASLRVRLVPFRGRVAPTRIFNRPLGLGVVPSRLAGAAERTALSPARISAAAVCAAVPARGAAVRVSVRNSDAIPYISKAKIHPHAQGAVLRAGSSPLLSITENRPFRARGSLGSSASASLSVNRERPLKPLTNALIPPTCAVRREISSHL